MLPVSNKQINKLMKQLGMKQEEIPAEQVIIKLSDKEIVVKNPSVVKVTFQGVETLQVTGIFEERPLQTNLEAFTEEDVKTVAEKANVDEETARKALQETNGDLAEAIMRLTQPEQD